MEKKKLLLVAISVGVFLVIVISTSLLIFTPSTDPASKRPAALSISDAYRPADPWETVNRDNQTVQVESPEASFAGIEEQVSSDPVPDTSVKHADDSPSMITVAPPRAAAVPDIPVKTTQTTSRPAAQPSVKTEPKPESKPAVVSRTVAARSQTDTRTYNNYWVQTGAFSSKIRAEGAKESLEAKGVTSIIDNSDINGRTWYRVRVGPYVSENEANYWLALVKAIDGFADSQVRLTQVAR